MKRVLTLVGALVVSLFLGQPGIASEPDIETDFMRESAAAWEEFDDHKATHHPWNSSIALPTSLKEAGLEEMVEFCPTMPNWRDGGSTGGWVKDARGNYFAFAIAAAFPVETAFGFNPRPIFYVGAAWWQDPLAVRVPFDSPCERFLIGLFGDHWTDFEASYYAKLEQALQNLRRSKVELDKEISGLETALGTYRQTKEAQIGATTAETP